MGVLSGVFMGVLRQVGQNLPTCDRGMETTKSFAKLAQQIWLLEFKIFEAYT